jgi:hypothetical protein
MAKQVTIEEKKEIKGNFNPVTVGEQNEITVKMGYRIDGDKKYFHGEAVKNEKEVGRVNYAPDTRLYLNVEAGVNAEDSKEIAQIFLEGLTQVLDME